MLPIYWRDKLKVAADCVLVLLMLFPLLWLAALLFLMAWQD